VIGFAGCGTGMEFDSEITTPTTRDDVASNDKTCGTRILAFVKFLSAPLTQTGGQLFFDALLVHKIDKIVDVEVDTKL
jgi:hypothetical protein